jgi:iron complex outermembrane receptor protein
MASCVDPLVAAERPSVGRNEPFIGKVLPSAARANTISASMRYAVALALLLLLAAPVTGLAQSTGTIVGVVALADSGQPLHNASVVILRLRKSVETDAEGRYRIDGVPPGTYDVLAHMDRFPDVVQQVTVQPEGEARLDFAMSLEVISEEVTVTASGREQSVLDAFQSVTTLNSIELTQKAAPGLGEVLQNEPGVAKRSFGPGSARPVIRGFDGDRVLVLQDGLRTGTVSSQSGDHGEQVDILSLDKIEIVKGPATLLYGSNAIGGVVNVVTGHSQVHDHPHEGLRGFLNATGGTANALGGVSGGFEYGHENWLFWGNGGGLRTGDYDTPIGTIENSQTRSGNFAAGAGYFGDRTFASFGYEQNDSRYGVPFAADFEAHDHGGEEEGEEEEEFIELALKRHHYRFTTGMRDLDAFVTNFRVTLTYTDYRHRELEGDEVGTTFDNDQFVYRAQFDQRPVGPLTGSFGVWGLFRDYETVGAEALAPPVTQNAFAVFALEELDFERVRFQFGGRVERNSYNPDGLRERSFTGFSGAAGVHVPLWRGGAVVANLTSSYRAPALEELYNFGPHIGNLTFEIGNPDLVRERSNGVDLSLRHESERLRSQINLFYYDIDDFVYLAPTGEIEDGLTEAVYRQSDSRFVGTEVDLAIALHRSLWLNLGFDSVDAELANGTSLPRIPPIRGRAGLEWTWKGLSVKPSVTLADAQDDLFPTETRTAGYAVFDLDASYTIAQAHVAHVFSFNAFNLGDRLYRNHLSFIKDLAPEIGRGVRFGYSLRFF